MDKSIDIKIAKYVDLIRDTFSDIESIYLFGSYVKGKLTDDSDIDIALIFTNLDDSNKFNIQIQLMMLASQIDTRIEPHPFSLDDFNTENPLMIEIRKTGVEIAA